MRNLIENEPEIAIKEISLISLYSGSVRNIWGNVVNWERGIAKKVSGSMHGGNYISSEEKKKGRKRVELLHCYDLLRVYSPV